MKVSLSFEIDENSAATNVSASGTSLSTLSSCVRSVVGQVQTQQAPDVGTVQVALVLQFTPI